MVCVCSDSDIDNNYPDEYTSNNGSINHYDGDENSNNGDDNNDNDNSEIVHRKQ